MRCRIAPRSVVPAVLLMLGSHGAWGNPQAHDSAAAGDPLPALRQQLQQLQAELAQLRQDNRALKRREEALEQAVEGLRAQVAGGAGAPAGPGQSAAAAAASQSLLPDAPAPAPAAPSPSSGPAATRSAAPWLTLSEALRLWGYGEVYYSRPTRSGERTRADLARAVFGIGSRFGPRTEFNSEFEIEHAVSSAGDVGEFEVEQLYVDHALTAGVSARAGLFLMPFGFLNEHHEPTAFHGMQRNFVETLVIPSTWREGGVSLWGRHGGFGWNVGVTTGFDLSKWSFDFAHPPYASALELVNSHIAPLQATHQELSLARADHLSQYLALSWFGTPGLLLGAAVDTGEADGIPDPITGQAATPRVTLWEGHARWTPGRFDLSALYARGTIGGTASSNAAHPGSPNPIPAGFYGAYLQAAYELWQSGDYRLSPFLRYEHYNLGDRYSGTRGPVIPAGRVPLSDRPGELGFWPRNADRVFTVGANFYVTPHVVLKADYQHFNENTDFTRVDLGLGLTF